jgi:alkylated DNA repair protein (DNA oxidative demethylase)
MSVLTTNCGALGWSSDAGGYRYTTREPTTSTTPWPPLPPALSSLATQAASQVGYRGFLPDACLINCYLPGASMGLHQDKNERDLAAPIVSVSLGLPAVFLWGGAQRAERPRKLRLVHGDVVVWGGPSRLRYHGVAPLRDGVHPVVGARRLNLTFRRAG